MTVQDRLWATVGTWVVVVVIGLLIASTAIDGEGRNPRDHVGPVPPSVVQINASEYLVPSEAYADTICGRETDNNGKPIYIEAALNTRPIENRRRKRVAQANRINVRERARSELRVAYANDEISAETYELKLAELER